MDPSDVEILRKNTQNLTKDLDPSEIYASLIQDGIVTADDTERIQTKGNNRAERALGLISLIQRKGPNAFAALLRALKPTCPHLHDLLLESDCVLEGESGKGGFSMQ